MLCTYELNGEVVDSVELKALLVTRGINIAADRLYERFGNTHRIAPPSDLRACNCLLLPDNTIVHMANVGPGSPFSLDVDSEGKACLAFQGQFVTAVDFPPRTDFYEQHTSGGIAFGDLAVLQGLDTLSFYYLWPCEYAKSGYVYQFCNQGAFTHWLAQAGAEDPRFPTPRDVADVVRYALEGKVARYVQLTGGSSMNPQAECAYVVEVLKAIDDAYGLDNVSGEVLVYTSPPANPAVIDEVFQAGADRVACSLEVWDEELAKLITPGKMKFAGRERFISTLLHIADKYGPNKACSTFVVGLEPVESFLAGAEYLASRGIVPIASVWLPHGRPVMGKTEAPGLDYYRRLRTGLREIYLKYNVEPPGDVGFNVCLCRDICKHHSDAVAGNCCTEEL